MFVSGDDDNLVVYVTNKNEKIFLFGFIFIIWQHFYKELVDINEKVEDFNYKKFNEI